MKSLRAAVVQAAPVLFDTGRTLTKLRELLADAAAHGAQLVVFPEAFIGGYPKGLGFGALLGSRSAAGREEFRRYFDSAIDIPGPATEEIGAAVREHALYVVVGVIERDGGTMRHVALEGRCFVQSACQYLTRGDCPENYDCPPGQVLIRGGSCIVGPLGQVLAGPEFGGETILTADVDPGEIARGKFDFDVAGHYARPDIFRLTVDTRARPAVVFGEHPESSDEVTS